MSELDGTAGATGLQEAAPIAPEGPGPVASQDDRRTLPPGWAWFAALVGPAVTAVCVALEPVPADPTASATVLDSLLGLALLASWGLAAGAALRRRPAALTWAAAASAIAVVLSILCPVSGHHAAVGAWWYTQMLVSGAALAISVVARSRFRSSP